MSRDLIVMSIATVGVSLMLLNGYLGRIEGVFLLLCIATYISWTVSHTRRTRSQRAHDESVVPQITENPLFNILLAVGGVAILVVGSELLVESSVRIAESIGVPNAVVGLSAAALGSSLPELTATVISARHGQPEMAAGNLVGSNIFNLLLILGATSVVRPLEMRSVTGIDIAVMILVTALAIALILARRLLGRREGGILVSTYCLYIVWLYLQ